jgi:phosphatidylglycerol---prolipoprotein diacylglyceryl transferase
MHPALHVFGLEISTYFLIISLACVISSLWFLRRASVHNMNSHTAIDLTICVLVSGFLGARLLHVFYEEPSFYMAEPLAALKIWNGGFVFLGGVVGALIGAMLFCGIRREPFWFWADVAVVPIALGYAIGRLACFANGCCYGKYCTLPWAVYMQGGSRHPTQLYAALYEMAVVFVLLGIEPRVRMAGLLFNCWLVLHALGRVMMEYFRDDPRGALIYGLSLGTWMSLGLGLFGLMNVLLAKGHRRLV